MYMLNMVIILIVMYSNVVTAIDKIPTYLLRFNTVGILQHGSVGSLPETSRPEMAFTKWAEESLVERRKYPYYYSFRYEYVRPHQTTR